MVFYLEEMPPKLSKYLEFQKEHTLFKSNKRLLVYDRMKNR